MKQTMTLAGILLAFALCLASCGGNNAKSNVNVPTEYCEELVKLAEEGNAEAQANLGVCYAQGEGVSVNADESVKWLKMAAEQGEPKAQFYLSVAYNRGFGVQQDFNESLRLLKESANQGFAKAQNDLGGVYEFGLGGVPKDANKALNWYRKAAEQGEPQAQWSVGADFYFKGDYAEAVKWFEKSAAQNYSGGQLMLGMCYFLGQGVDQDKTIGYDLVRKAAEQGNESAIQELEILKANM